MATLKNRITRWQLSLFYNKIYLSSTSLVILLIYEILDVEKLKLDLWGEQEYTYLRANDQ